MATFQTGRYYEVQKYVSLTRQMWDGQWSLANGALWKSLPADIQTIIANNLNQSALDQRADVVALENQVILDLPKHGVEVFKVDQKPFHEKVKSAGFYTEWKGKFSPEAWALLEKYAGPIT